MYRKKNYMYIVYPSFLVRRQWCTWNVFNTRPEKLGEHPQENVLQETAEAVQETSGLLINNCAQWLRTDMKSQ